MKKIVLIVAASVTLSACTTITALTDVESIGSDTYVVTAFASGPNAVASDARDEAHSEAEKQCSALRRQLVVNEGASFKTTFRKLHGNNLISFRLVFRCLLDGQTVPEASNLRDSKG